MIDMIDPWDDRPIGKLAIVAGLVVVAGCQAPTQRMGHTGGNATSQPVDRPVKQIQQTGAVPLVTEAVTGLSFTQHGALPIGLALLLAFDKWLSHRREMTRLRGIAIRQAPTPPPGGG